MSLSTNRYTQRQFNGVRVVVCAWDTRTEVVTRRADISLRVAQDEEKQADGLVTPSQQETSELAVKGKTGGRMGRRLRVSSQ